ncbi:hypothetical protein VTJ83DRAFT_2314 [Remersonia thermophila]|uniref:tRNA (guanine-N(7)-)-methyltransferase non-catalytic subunit TRM82 n=1 Tax=Remersonia thermophila TaxID=72144 RepID=A0ABR4DIG8_9PEZI
MVAFPYHLVKACGGIVFAAQGSDIHSFNSRLEHVSTWTYPHQHAAEATRPAEEAQDSPAPEGPPAKRRRVEDGDDATAPNGHGQQPSSNGQPRGSKAAQYDNPANERAFLQGLYATADGRHLIAITGCDKTIWVFEHDGAGHLKELSRRAMPKRPCALTLTRDNRTILSADKFGDVYALPLIPAAAPTPDSTSSPAAATPAALTPTIPLSRSETPVILRPEANELTVHTKRNLRALENQKISLERKAAREAEQLEPSRPRFEHALLLGHVSMLTAIAVGVAPSSSSSSSDPAAKTREYIVTADRDEHIRVSRGIPQAHVIEGFCLGHEDFVSRLCIAPGGREELLLSGGGDDDVLVWDWRGGRLLARAPVLQHVKQVKGLEEATKVAVTRVFATSKWHVTTDGTERTLVFIVAERVPALLVYELWPDNTLQHRCNIPLPGNPLDLDVLEGETSGPGNTSCRLVVALDPTQKGSSSATTEAEEEPGCRRRRATLMFMDNAGDEGKLVPVENLPAAGGADIGEAELHRLLYTTEALRKLTDYE